MVEETPSVKDHFGDSFLQAGLGNHFTNLLCHFLETKHHNIELSSETKHKPFIKKQLQMEVFF